MSALFLGIICFVTGAVSGSSFSFWVRRHHCRRVDERWYSYAQSLIDADLERMRKSQVPEVNDGSDV